MKSILSIALLLTALTAAIGVSNQVSAPPVEEASGKHAAKTPVSPPRVKEPARENYVEVQHLIRGYCYAQTQLPDKDALGGFGPSDNAAKATRPAVKGLYLVAEPEVATKLGEHASMRLSLVNGTAHTLSFSACDSRLSIVQQAQNKQGQWQDIEYLPQSWCGNSYHRVLLQPDHAWEFAALRYRGPFETQLRFALKLNDGSQLFSNEFAGSIDPAQFTAKPQYNPQGIMDPYLD